MHRQGRAFLPPKNNRLVISLTRLLLPFYMQGPLGGLSVRISEADLEKLQALKGQRLLLLPNHPTGEEPFVIGEISRRLNQSFNYMAARELFTWMGGFQGWYMQRAGVYSVIRGAVDRESFAMTQKILTEGRSTLVIFIEGEMSHENDTLIPFEPGVLQLGFWAQEKLARNPESPADYPGITVAPVAIKYFYHRGAEGVIEKSLRGLEGALGIREIAGGNTQRIHRIGEKILGVQEQFLDLQVPTELSLDERVDCVKNRMLKKMELFLDIHPSENAGQLERVREIRNRMDRLIFMYETPQNFTDYEQRMLDHMRETFREFYEDLDRVIYFLTFHEDYLREPTPPERFIDMLRRLEKEVFGKPRLYYPRTAVVQVGEPISLKAQFAAYEQNKKQAVRDIASRLEADMDQLLKHAQRPTDI